MNFKKIIQDRSGFTWAAAAITMLVAIAVVGLGGAVMVNYVFKQADRQPTSFNECVVNYARDPKECGILFPQQPQPTVTENRVETPTIDAPRINVNEGLCKEKGPYYNLNQEGCDAKFPPTEPVKPVEPVEPSGATTE